MTISGIKNICFAETPGWTNQDVLKGWSGAYCHEYDAVGPWSSPVDDGHSGEVTDTTEIRNGVEVHVTTLTFRLCDDIDAADIPHGCNAQCWRWMEKDGSRYFIGNGARPYPARVVSNENSRGANAKIRTVTITWTSLTGPLKVK